MWEIFLFFFSMSGCVDAPQKIGKLHLASNTPGLNKVLWKKVMASHHLHSEAWSIVGHQDEPGAEPRWSTYHDPTHQGWFTVVFPILDCAGVGTKTGRCCLNK